MIDDSVSLSLASQAERLEEFSKLSLMLSGDPQEVLHRLLRGIGELFDVRAVYLSEVGGDQLSFLAVYSAGTVAFDAGQCSLGDTPCAAVERDKVLKVFEPVAELFPVVEYLQQHSAVSYCGFPILDRSGNVIAVACLLDDKPREYSRKNKELLAVIGQRIARELESEAFERKHVKHEVLLSDSNSKQLRGNLFDTLPRGIQENDTQGRITYSNSAHHRILGYADGELVGRYIWDFECSEEKQRELEVYFKYLLEQQSLPEPFITLVRRKDGRLVDLQVDWDYKRDSRNNIIGFISVISDISMQKQTERSVQLLQEVSRICLQASHDESMLDDVLSQLLEGFDADRAWLLYPCDPEAPTWSIAREVTQPEWPGITAGKGRAEMPGSVATARLFHEVLTSDSSIAYVTDADWPQELKEQLKQFSVKSQLVAVLRPKLGKPWLMGIHHCATQHHYSESERRLFTTIAQRVTETLSSQLSFKELENTQANLVEAQRIARLGSWEYDIAHDVCHNSDEIYRIVGLEPQSVELTNDMFRRLVHPDDLAAVEAMDNEVMTGGGPAEAIFRITRPDGEVRTILSKTQALRDETGKPIKMFGYDQDITQRVQADEALRRSEESLAAAQRLARLGSWDWDIVADQAVCSSGIYHILGLTPETFGANFEEFLSCVHPDERAMVKEAIHASLYDCNVPYRIEHRIVRPDGEERVVQAMADILRNEEDMPVRMVGAIQDITEQKLAERAVKESETKWRSFTEFSPDHIMLVDLQGNIQFINYTVPGLRQEQVIGRPMVEFLPEAFRSVAQACLDGVIESGEADIFECEYQDQDGNVSYFESRVGPIVDGEKVSALIVCARDISVRKRIENELRLSAKVFENTAESVLITDADNRIVSVNEAFVRITGYTRDEVVGEKPNILKSDRHEDAFYAELWATLNTTGHWRGEIWNRRKNGELFPAWQTISAVEDERGTIVNYVSVMADISSFKQSQAQLDFLAYHDPLTELPNRLLLLDRLDHALQRAKRFRQQLAVLFLDLDRFKNINDSLGHAVGDSVLQLAAERIGSEVRAEDTISRLGGDEFVIILDQIDDVQDAASLAQKLIAAFQQPFIADQHELHLSISMGISIYPSDGENGDTLIKNADAAMYKAKEEGRNDYQFYTEALTTTAFERLTLETALRRAMERDQLVLHYQPQYSLTSGEMIGAEALVRWQHPQMGLIAPDKFIPLAEDTGLIVPIGEWVLMRACEDVQKWRASGDFAGRIAVNVSGRQFYRGKFVEVVHEILDETGLEPQYLDIEITESILIQEAGKAAQVLSDLKALGVRISIDDFGTGYSSLSYLKTFSVDTLKIDRSFIRDIPDDPNDEAITRATIALAHSLQLEVVAEGVETEQQCDFLKSLSCDLAQGFLFSRALPAEEFTELLKKR